MGLEEFKEVEIRSSSMGINMLITHSHIAKLLKIDNIGICALNTKYSNP